MGDIYYTSANISMLAEQYKCPEGSVASHSPSLFHKKDGKDINALLRTFA